MSEKRFEFYSDDYLIGVLDTVTGRTLNHFETIDLLNGQQSTIEQLQDLCGESDGKNARLRMVNKNLKEINRQLRKINKEIGDDLHNCRLNKNIISEKLKLWQDTLVEYDIYTINDFVESFELDAKTNKEKDEKIKELQVKVLNLELEIKRLEKMIWKIQWRFQQEVGIEKAREHYREIDKEMEE